MAQPLLARALACVALAALAPAQESDWAAQANAALAKFERGARCEEQAIVLLETAPGDEASRATALGLLLALADAAVQLREADEGLASQLDALATKEWIPPPAQARLCYASGEIRFRIGSLEAADKSLADAMRFDPTLTLHLANRRCFVQIARGDMVTALAMSEIAREASTSELDRRRTSQTRADLALRIGLFDEEARSLAAARGPETGEDYDALAELRIEAELALALEDFERANEVAARWRDRAITAGDHGIASLQRATIALLRAKAALEGPQRALMDAQRILDDASWPAANRAQALRITIALQLQLGLRDEARLLAQRLTAGRAFDALSPDDLAIVAAATLTDSSLAGEQVTALRAALDVAWNAQIEAWKALGERTGRLAFLQLRARRDLGSALLSALARELGPRAGEACLLRLLAAEGAGTSARELGLRDIDVATVRATLIAHGERVLVHLPASIGSHCLEITKDSVDRFDLPSDLGLRASVRVARSLLAESGDEVALRDAAARLLPHVAPTGNGSWFGTEPLVIVGRELLAGIPFEALPTKDTNSPWLGLRAPISYLPSLRLGVWLAERTAPVSASACALFATGLNPADLARWRQSDLVLDDAQMCEPLSPIAPSQRIAIPAADRAAFDAPPCSALLLFAHGIYDAEADSKNGFLLATKDQASGAVFASECAALRFPPFVALAVCGAARTSLRRGDDGGGDLVDAVMRGGARTVLASEHDLRVDDAVAITRETMRGLADGKTSAEALLFARRSRASDGYGHPSRWSSMRLEGLGASRTQLTPAPYSFPWMTAACGALAAIAGLLIARAVARGRQ
jgi:hypothetical protein